MLVDSLRKFPHLCFPLVPPRFHSFLVHVFEPTPNESTVFGMPFNLTRPLEEQYMLFLKTTPNYPETGLTRINPS